MLETAGKENKRNKNIRRVWRSVVGSIFGVVLMCVLLRGGAS